MTDSAVRATIRTVVFTSVVLVVGAFTTMVWRHGAGRLAESDVPTAFVIVIGLGAVVWVASGQQPRNRLVWVLTAFVASVAWFAAATAIRTILAPELPFRLTVESGAPAELPRAAAWLEYAALPLSSSASLLLITFGLMLFPDGTLPSKRWRPVGIAAGAVLAIGLVRNLIIWHPDSTYVIAEHPLFHLLSPVDIGLPLVALAAVVVRFRRSEGDERARFKWVVWGLGVFVPLTLVGWMSGITVIAALANFVLIGTYGIAITRHHLFDVDVVISKTLVYAALAGFIGLVYVAIVVGVGAWVGTGSEPNPVLAVGATALVAVAFQPVRRRLERVANRVVFGRRATPYEVLSEFSRRVAATGGSLLDDAARWLAEGTAATRVVVSLRIDGKSREAASWPSASNGAPAEPVRLPIADGGVTLGTLDLYLPPNQPLNDEDRRLAEQVASGMGLAVRNQLLTERLEARVQALRESRRRLVAVQDETRRRLERDLHDGAQQQLVALKVKLGLSRTIADQAGATHTADLLERLAAEADEAVDAMREFARGVYPPLLEAEGLTAAIAAQARRAPLPVAVNSDGMDRYSRDVEATVYFCVLEALRNTIQHAGASSAAVTLGQDNGTLEFRISDDGTGFDPTSTSRSGLITMTDRVDALAGHLTVASSPATGTTITGTLPVDVPVEVPS